MTAPLTPGAYLRLRRTAAGLSVEDVVDLVGTVPHDHSHRRAEWIAAVEGDRVAITGDIVDALRRAFPFDPRILVQLIAIHAGGEILAPDVCRACGCSWDDPCAEGCGWRDKDRTLCTACPEPIPAAIAANAARVDAFTGGDR